MKLIVPAYYPDFRCIADACRHSCCIGWEIDIDEESLQFYKTVDGKLGQRLQDNIDETGDCPHFILGEHERCPFLNEQNLCDLIIGLGEDALCQICDDHPRYRSDFSDRTEIGLGLCCEGAAKLILTHPEPVKLIVMEDDGNSLDSDEEEEYLFSVRDNAVAIAQDREFTVAERMENLSCFFDFPLPNNPAAWADVYLELERLDEKWTDCLHTVRSDFISQDFPDWETAFEQLLVYFLYRHLPAALNDGDIVSKVAFAVLSVHMLQWLCSAKDDICFDDLLEFARLYSSEIEYSDENLDILFEKLCKTE